MKITLETPVILRIEFDSEEERHKATEDLTYTNTSIAYQIKMTKESAFKYGEAWAANRVAELETELNPCMLFEDERGYFTRPGLSRFLQNRFTCTVSNSVEYPEFKQIPWAKPPEFAPHRAQSEAVSRMLSAPHSHIEFATGTGKSYVAELLVKGTGLPTVISTPSKSIARQMYAECSELFGKQKVGLLGDTKREIGKHILIAIGKSLALVKDPEELEALKKYQVLISDESHLMPADQFEYFCHNVLGHCPYRWFVSGTQERSDGADLKLLSIIGPQVHSYPIEKAIEDGVLAKLSFLVFNTRSDSYFDSPNVVRMNQEHIYKNERIAATVSTIAAQAVTNGMPVLILIDEHIQEELLQTHMKVPYVYACGKEKNHKICQDFNDGRIMCVVGNSAVSTGTNFKPVRITLNWQAGKSPVKVKQGPIGRSTRTDARTGKTECKIVDFRITNVRKLKKHADERVEIYRQIGPIEFADLDTSSKELRS